MKKQKTEIKIEMKKLNIDGFALHIFVAHIACNKIHSYLQ